ncbi:DUF6284 family protein [Kineosporia rhizophila]|uniref:DUF6284 family protein n=1 Tax=Kineosporia rhizophila TaxID=84633 RepID=UPI000A8010A2|nr:DUF6284 family protein [Kineosporia rhizophila]MCE0535749.1 DUF6284 family protein [Kineosporia rhizophila]
MRAVGDGPSRAELRAIEAEWPLIEAEMDVLDAEIVLLRNEPNADELAVRRLRRAEAEVTRRMREFFALDAGTLDDAA